MWKPKATCRRSDRTNPDKILSHFGPGKSSQERSLELLENWLLPGLCSHRITLQGFPLPVAGPGHPNGDPPIQKAQ